MQSYARRFIHRKLLTETPESCQARAREISVHLDPPQTCREPCPPAPFGTSFFTRHFFDCFTIFFGDRIVSGAASIALGIRMPWVLHAINRHPSEQNSPFLPLAAGLNLRLQFLQTRLPNPVPLSNKRANLDSFFPMKGSSFSFILKRYSDLNIVSSEFR
jgi:hypothetical protein